MHINEIGQMALNSEMAWITLVLVQCVNVISWQPLRLVTLFVLSPDGSPDGIPGLQIVSVRSLAGGEHDVPSGGREEHKQSFSPDLVMDKYVEQILHECKACGKI